jgi:PAS domain S-box-containing protein
MLEHNNKMQEVFFTYVYHPLKNDKNKTTSIMVVANVVTEQVKARQQVENSAARFQSLINAIPQIAWTNKPDGEVDFYNQRWYDYTGLNFEQTRAWGWKTVIHPDDLEYNLISYQTILNSNKEGKFEVREKRADGDYRWHLINLQPVSDSMNKVHHWVGTATDIHDLKLLEEQKDDFISIASHELKTPITTLSASLQLLNKMKDKPAIERLPTLIDHANKSLEKVNHLVKNLLNVTQFNKGQLHLDKSWISLSVLIKDSCAQVLADKTYTFRTEGIWMFRSMPMPCV